MITINLHLLIQFTNRNFILTTKKKWRHQLPESGQIVCKDYIKKTCHQKLEFL